jgi:hypothetical protein
MLLFPISYRSSHNGNLRGRGVRTKKKHILIFLYVRDRTFETQKWNKIFYLLVNLMLLFIENLATLIMDFNRSSNTNYSFIYSVYRTNMFDRLVRKNFYRIFFNDWTKLLSHSFPIIIHFRLINGTNIMEEISFWEIVKFQYIIK